MKCPYCGNSTHKVVDKRAVSRIGEIRRRRQCLKCARRFTTYEKLANVELVVIKKDGRKELFSKDKLTAGIVKSLEKRPAENRANYLADRIERRLYKRLNRQVSSKQIGKMVLSELKKIDGVAYLRFASVYRRFESYKDFTKEASLLSS